MSRKVKMIALLKVTPGMTRDEFIKRWVDDHAPFTLQFPNLKGYLINIPIEEFQQIEGPLPYDGTAELFWDSIEDAKADFASAAAAAAGADADEFSYVREHVFVEEFVAKPRS
jgi:uncharacterized protein (TIGR02118 family)